MTADELQAIVLRLSNAKFVRYWLSFGPLPRDRHLMAIQVLGLVGSGYFPARVEELERRGFSPAFGYREQDYIYVIDRTNEDGTPFTSPL